MIHLLIKPWSNHLLPGLLPLPLPLSLSLSLSRFKAIFDRERSFKDRASRILEDVEDLDGGGLEWEGEGGIG